MHRVLNILFGICLMGIMLAPFESFACASTSEHIIQNELSTCLLTTLDQEPSECKESCCMIYGGLLDCSMSCDADSCHSTSFYYWIQSLKYTNDNIVFEAKEVYSSYKEPIYSSRVLSIWQPPKIA